MILSKKKHENVYTEQVRASMGTTNSWSFGSKFGTVRLGHKVYINQYQFSTEVYVCLYTF